MTTKKIEVQIVIGPLMMTPLLRITTSGKVTSLSCLMLKIKIITKRKLFLNSWKRIVDLLSLLKMLEIYLLVNNLPVHQKVQCHQKNKNRSFLINLEKRPKRKNKLRFMKEVNLNPTQRPVPQKNLGHKYKSLNLVQSLL